MGSHDDLVSKLSARHRDYLSMPNMQELAISGEEEMEEEDAISEEADDACDSAPVLNNVTRPRRTRAAAMDDAESSKKVTFAAPKVDTSSDSAYNSAELSPADTVIPFELLEYGRKVGSGGFKDVYQGTLNGQEVAIAEIKSLDDDEWADLENELAVLG